MNVPDDWGSYNRTCDRCGAHYHASEGGCDCEERAQEEQHQRIWDAVVQVAAWMQNAIDVGPGPVITLSRPMTRACGWQDDDPTAYELGNRRTLLRLLGQVAERAGENIELRVTGRDGETWTEDTIDQ